MNTLNTILRINGDKLLIVSTDQVDDYKKMYCRRNPAALTISKFDVDVDGLPSIDQFVVRVSKGDLAKAIIPESVTYDAALPQVWLNQFDGMDYYTILGGVVWTHENCDIFGKPKAITIEAARILGGLNV